MKIVLRILAFVAATFILFYKNDGGYADIGAIVLAWFVFEYILLFSSKRKPLINDEGGVSIIKKVLSTIIPPGLFVALIFLVKAVSPNQSNIEIATTIIFIILIIFSVLFIDIKRRTEGLSKSVNDGFLLSIILSTIIFIFIRLGIF